MKAFFWILAIACAGVGLTLLAHYNTGYVLLALPSYRVELSLNLLAIILLAAFIIGYLVVRLVSGTVRLPAQVREYRLARRRDRARAPLL
ncbi:MAG: heme biosynthesis protein HemY, partial [Betaproteobacteria bacterium]|nr:heme biosynthesis protein HemY [Betaproteobacteria bacterium]